MISNGAFEHPGGTPDVYIYGVFDLITEGLNIVGTVENVATSTRDYYRDVPVSSIEILLITVH